MKREIFLFLTILFCISLFSQTPVENGLRTINRNRLESYLNFIASDWLEGREATTKGAYIAADFIAGIYHENGLSPCGDDSSYFQNVPLVIAYPTRKATLKFISKNESIYFDSTKFFISKQSPISHSISGHIVWGGFGINQEELNEVNLKKTKNGVIIILSGVPELNAFSKFKDILSSKNVKEWKAYKQNTIENSGAVAIIKYDINNPNINDNFTDNPIKTQTATTEKILHKRSSGIYKKDFYLTEDVGKSIPVYEVSKIIIEQIIPDFQTQLNDYLNNLESGKVVPIQDFSIVTAHLSTEANVEYKNCRNVLAMIKGTKYPNEIIVIGAHYDHIGMYDGYIWNGADDNGSGTVGVMAIAKAFASTGIKPKRTVIFANWTAEERGILGSRFFVKQFEDISKIKYYHNYDMIGRSVSYEENDSSVALLYTKEWKQAEELADKFNKTYNLGLNIKFSPWDKPTSGSDNSAFAKEEIPIMWFHTGDHSSYHMPDDHTDKIDWVKFEKIVRLSFLTLWKLANE